MMLSTCVLNAGGSVISWITADDMNCGAIEMLRSFNSNLKTFRATLTNSENIVNYIIRSIYSGL